MAIGIQSKEGMFGILYDTLRDSGETGYNATLIACRLVEAIPEDTRNKRKELINTISNMEQALSKLSLELQKL